MFNTGGAQDQRHNDEKCSTETYAAKVVAGGHALSEQINQAGIITGQAAAVLLDLAVRMRLKNACEQLYLGS